VVYSSSEHVIESSFSKRIVIMLLSEALALAVVTVAAVVLPNVLPSLSGHGLLMARWISGMGGIFILCFGIAAAVGQK
jgi:hypothetical protein